MKPQNKLIQIVLNNFKNDNRVLKESVSLKNKGFSVVVVALHEEPFAERECIQQIDVHRVKLATRRWSKHKIVQIIKYFELLFKVVKEYRHSDFFHCNDLNALPIGICIKLFFNRQAKVIYDAHEYEINDIPNQSKFSIKLKYLLEKLLIKYTDGVITVSNSIADEYQRLYKIKKPAVVLNCPNYIKISKQDLFRTELGIRDEQVIFLYQGVLGYGRGVELLLEVFSHLDSDKNVIVFMGYGLLESKILEYAKRYPNIFFRMAVTPDILLNYTGSADYGVSFIEDTCLSHRYCLPNKMFEYLMAGLPVLTSNLVEMKQVVETYRVGVVAGENTVEGFISAIQKSLTINRTEIQKNIENVQKIFNWETQEITLLRLYDNL